MAHLIFLPDKVMILTIHANFTVLFFLVWHHASAVGSRLIKLIDNKLYKQEIFCYFDWMQKVF